MRNQNKFNEIVEVEVYSNKLEEEIFLVFEADVDEEEANFKIITVGGVDKYLTEDEELDVIEEFENSLQDLYIDYGHYW